MNDESYMIVNYLIILKDILHMIFIIGPVICVLLFVLKYLIVQNALKLMHGLKDVVLRAIESLRYALGVYATAPPSGPFSYNTILRSLESSSYEMGSSIQTPRSMYMLNLMSNLFAQGALGLPYANRSFVLCDPKNSEKNLECALVLFLYGRLRSEAISPTPANPAGNMDLLAECPNNLAANMPGLSDFPACFKTIKDIAIEDILRPTPNAGALSIAQHKFLIDTIRFIMLKRVFGNIQAFKAAIGEEEVNRIINDISTKELLPSNLDMIKFISRCFSVNVTIIEPMNRANNNIYTASNITTWGNFPPAIYLTEMVLLEQEPNSFTLVV